MLFAAVPVQAADTLVPGVGSPDSDDVFPVNGSGSDFVDVRMALDADRSYECTAISEDNGSGPKLAFYSVLSGVLDEEANKIKLIGAESPVTYGDAASAAGSRITITPIESGDYYLRITNSIPITLSHRLKCFETTLYGGYNTNANPLNFLELSNLTNSTVSGRVRGFNADGSQILDTTFSIGANSRFDIDIHSAAGANRYGILIVTNDAPRGGLQGNVSQYSSGLVLRVTVPLSPRDQISQF